MSKDALDEVSGIKDLVRQHWRRRAADFDQGPSHGLLSQRQHDAWRDLLIDVFGPKPLDVADLGCGTGFLALLMAELGHRVTGIDFADEMLTEARRKAEAAGYVVEFHQGDAEAPFLPPASFDVLLERHVIWTLPQPERALGAWLSILRPGGRICLIEGDWDMTIKDEYAAIHDRLPLFGGSPSEALAEMVRGMGFVEVSVRPLMDAALWHEVPRHSRYAVLARSP
jgi:ubiquinone/menaquinone biosynthesis C-methylase UbiE